jgi:DNA replicative helicase MCM subunit Mcm2 (Cdc46/Mcm family)
MPAYYCPKCGSEDVLDYTNSEVPAANQTPMFCTDCHTVGSKERFSKKPHFWNWNFWRIRPLPLLLTIGIAVCIPGSGAVRGIVFLVVYVLLSSFTLRRRNGKRVFPPYVW